MDAVLHTAAIQLKHSMLVAFGCRAGGQPILDWTDLLQPKLKGRLGFVDAPREFLGAAMRSLGLSMNEDISGGSCEATFADVQARVQQLRKQVRLWYPALFFVPPGRQA